MTGIFTKAASLLTKKRLLYISSVAILSLLVVFVVLIRFDISGNFEGIYLLKRSHGALFDLQDDLFLGDERRLIFRLDFEPVYELLHPASRSGSQTVHLRHEWSEQNGNGYVVTHLPGGSQLLTCFSRYRVHENISSKGLFVGGGLPFSKNEEGEVTMNETGMAFYTGKEWHHIWCNSNEAIVSQSGRILYPQDWKFLGSRVLEANDKKVVIKSSHEISLDGADLRVDRYAFFKAGDTFFILAIVIRSRAPFATAYLYVYGDEPWVGEYGSSIGNVGWVKDRQLNYECSVDAGKYSFAGMWDVGNPAVPGEFEAGKNITGMANFIEWLGDNRPDRVYFSNTMGKFADESRKVPLSSRDNRVLFLQWGPRFIEPHQDQVILLGIGMAGIGPQKKLPVKPSVSLSDEDRAYLHQ